MSRVKVEWKWRKVDGPQTWRPKEAGEELVGHFHGKTARHGTNGQYEVVMVSDMTKRLWCVSGVKVLQLFDASGISSGHLVRLVFLGRIPLDNGRVMKQFELFVVEGPKLLPAPKDLEALGVVQSARVDA